MENYEYIGDLGSGSYGFVWKCLQRSTGKTVAVKGFKLAHTDKKFFDQAIREVRMLRAACDHPNIVQLLEAFRSSSGRVYMVFEYVDRCLSSELHKRFTCGLPAAQTRRVLYQLLCAVAHLHSKKIVHRDIKPGNLLMTAEGVVKLCDFGFARTTRGEPYQADRFSSYVVTRWYRSPEMLVSDLYGAASDIWSLGCTFAELATGRPLFPGTSSLDQLWRIMRCLGSLSQSQAERFAAAAAAAGLPETPPPPPRGKSLWQRLPELDNQLLDVVQACLRMDPAQRPTAVQLLQMPYFFDVPALFVGTPLEQAYAEQGSLGSRPRTISGRCRPPQALPEMAARGGGGASAPTPSAAVAPLQGAVAVSVMSSEELVLAAEVKRAAMAAAGAPDDGGGGGAPATRRNPPRQPSVLLSAVAASLLGEHPPREGCSSGSIPLVPLAAPTVPAPAATEVGSGDAAAATAADASRKAETAIEAPLVRSAGFPQVAQLRRVGLTSSEVHGGAGGGGAAGAAAAAVAATTGSGPAGRPATSSMVIHSPSPCASPGPPSASRPLTSGNSPRTLPSLPQQHSRRSGLSSAATAATAMATATALGTTTAAASAAGVVLPGGEAAPGALVPKAAVPPAGEKAGGPPLPVGVGTREGGTAGSGSSVGEEVPVVVSRQLAEADVFSDGRIAAAVLAAASGSRAGPTVAAAVGTPANGVTRAPPVSDEAALVSGDSAVPRGGGGGANCFGLIAGDDDDLLSDGDGQISEDDELMEYFAAKSNGSSAVRGGSRRVMAVAGSLVGGVAAAGRATGGCMTTSGSGMRPAGVGSSSTRRLPLDVPHAGIQAVHHGLYGGSCHASGTGASAPMPLNRRMAVLTGEGGGSGGGGGGGGCGSPQSQLPAPPAAAVTLQAKRTTVGSYLSVPPVAESSAAAAAAATAAAVAAEQLPTAPSPTRPRTATAGFPKAAAAEVAMPYRAPQRPATESQASRGGLPYLTPSQHPTPHHHGTTTGIALPSSASVSVPVHHHGRTSLPAAGYGAPGGMLQYTASGNIAGSGNTRSRALSRQGSVVFNQLMYDALPEIGTPGGAPEVLTVTPPRRRVVMSGFTPCRTAAARAAAAGLPPAAAMAAVLGDTLQSTTTDISVAFSPIHVGRSVDLMSPDRESGVQAHPYNTAGGSASVGMSSATAAAAGAHRCHHRRQASLHSAEPGYTVDGSLGTCGPSHPITNLYHNTPAAAAAGPYAYPGPAKLHASQHASVTSDTGMLMGSSAPSYYRTPRAGDGTAAATAAGTASLSGAGTAGPVPIPGGAAGRLPGAINLSGAAAAAAASSSCSPSSSIHATASVASRSGHQHQVAVPVARSRLASGNMARESDFSGATAGAASCHLGAADGTQSMELDGLEATGFSLHVHGGPGGPGHPGMMPPPPLPPGAAPSQQAMGPPPVAGRVRGGRWAAVLIDSLPEDREVLHSEWQGGSGYQVQPGCGSGRMPGNSPERCDDAIQMLSVHSPEWGYSGPPQQALAAPPPPGLRSPPCGGLAPRPPALPRNGSGADLCSAATASGDAAAGVGGGFLRGQSSNRSRRNLAVAAMATSASAGGRDGRREGSNHPYGESSRPSDQASTAAAAEPAAVAAGRTSAPGAIAGGDSGAAAAPGRKQSGSGSRWPKAKALLGGRLISTLVRKFKEQSGGSSADK